MDRVAKFFIPLQQTRTAVNAGPAGLQLVTSTPYRLPESFFPLPANQFVRFPIVNVFVSPVGASIDAVLSAAQLVALSNAGVTGYIVSFPAFPLASSAILQPSILGPSPALVLPAVNVGWEWDTFVNLGVPIFFQVRVAVNVTVNGGLDIGFEATAEIWRV